MGFKMGIVGLPNVGKSTLFNALTRTAAAQAANFPFCTIEPNVGEVNVPDARLDTLARIGGSASIIPTRMTFVDIAGLVKGASKGDWEVELVAVIGRRASTTSASVTAEAAAMSHASARSIPAVAPSSTSSSPAACAPGRVWMTVISTTPRPKKLDSTAPMAASSPRRVRRVSQLTQSRPSPAEAAAPSNSPGSARPSPPAMTIRMKASPIPGRVAWLTASLTSARLPSTRNTPVTPAAIPSSPAPSVTSVAL